MIRFEQPDGHSVIWYDASDLAKYLQIKDINGKIIGRNKFLQLLRFNGAIMSDSNQPKQTMITLGLMRYHLTNKRCKQYGMPLFSDKGISYIQARLEDGRFQVQFLKRKEKYVVQKEDVF